MKTLSVKFYLIHVMVLLMLCFTFTDVEAQSGQYKIRLAHALTATLGNPPHATALKFAEIVNKDTNGRIKIEVYGGGVLGGERALSEQLTLGAIEMGILGVASAAAHLSEKVTTEELPYAWDSYDQILKAYNGDLGKLLKPIYTEKGKMISLVYLPFGFRHITNNVRPIKQPADLAGLKLRSAEVPLRVDAFRQLKVQVVPIAFPELFTALQQGTVDGQENPVSLIKDGRFFEAQKYLSLTGHIISMNHFVINESFYKKLPNDLKQILNDDAQKMQNFMLDRVNETDKNALEFLKKVMSVTENIDKKVFRVAMAPVYTKYKNVFGSDIWAAVEKYSSIKAK